MVALVYRFGDKKLIVELIESKDALNKRIIVLVHIGATIIGVTNIIKGLK
jgi:hypothetical protein